MELALNRVPSKPNEIIIFISSCGEWKCYTGIFAVDDCLHDLFRPHARLAHRMNHQLWFTAHRGGCTVLYCCSRHLVHRTWRMFRRKCNSVLSSGGQRRAISLHIAPQGKSEQVSASQRPPVANALLDRINSSPMIAWQPPPSSGPAMTRRSSPSHPSSAPVCTTNRRPRRCFHRVPHGVAGHEDHWNLQWGARRNARERHCRCQTGLSRQGPRWAEHCSSVLFTLRSVAHPPARHGTAWKQTFSTGVWWQPT